MKHTVSRSAIIVATVAPLVGVGAVVATAAPAPSSQIVTADPTVPGDGPSAPTEDPSVPTEDPSVPGEDPVPAAPSDVDIDLIVTTRKPALGQVITVVAKVQVEGADADVVGTPAAGVEVSFCVAPKLGRGGWGSPACATGPVTTDASGRAAYSFVAAAMSKITATTSATQAVLAGSGETVVKPVTPKVKAKGKRSGKVGHLTVTVDPAVKTRVTVKRLSGATWSSVRTQYTDAKGKVTIGGLKLGTYQVVPVGSSSGAVVKL